MLLVGGFGDYQETQTGSARYVAKSGFFTCSQYLGLLEKLGRERLTQEERHDIQGCLGDEIAAVGVDTNGEINKYGIELDDLISVIAMM